MPVYFLTFHAYRSWQADRTEGYFHRGSKGRQQPNTKYARQREASARAEAVLFDQHQQQVLIDAAKEICARRDWSLYAMSVNPTHRHILFGWAGREDIDVVRTRMKSLLVKSLSDDTGTTGNRWFSRGQHTEQVLNESHMEELVVRYVPKHRRENGSVYVKLWGEEFDR